MIPKITLTKALSVTVLGLLSVAHAENNVYHSTPESSRLAPMTDASALDGVRSATETAGQQTQYPPLDNVTESAVTESAPAYQNNQVKLEAALMPDITPEFKFLIITRIDDLWKEESRNLDPTLRAAQLAARTDNYAEAEKAFLVALNKNLTKNERYLGLLQMAAMYQEAGEYINNESYNKRFLALFGDRALVRQHLNGSVSNIVKAISVYEKFLHHYKHDDLAPIVNLQLGRLYRQIGTTELAISRFFDVMQISLDIAPENFDSYKKLSRDAKKEIADTYFLVGSFKDALKNLLNLQQVGLSSDARQEVMFKIGYCKYMLNQSERAKVAFETFLREYPQSILAPESHYLLSKIFYNMSKPQHAVDQMMQLLSNKHIRSDEDEEIWKYWQKRAGNELANIFYGQADWDSALRLYLAMLKLDTSPSWRYPMLYQIGLTFERAGAPDEALKSFRSVADGELWSEKTEKEAFQTYAGKETGDEFKMIRELAKWHAAKIEWNDEVHNKLQRLLLDEAGS